MVKRKKQEDEELTSAPTISTVAMRDIQIDEYLLECVTIEPTMLDDEFVRVPVDLAYWHERYSESIRSYLLAKLEYDQARARVGLELREEVAAMGVKKTVGDIEAMITVHPDVSAAYLALVEADAEKQSLRNRCEAVQAKREMLQSLGAKMRAEMMSDPALRDQIIAQKLNQ
jgi:hypothetical protein